MNVCLDNIFWTAKLFFFLTKLCMVMHHQEPECLAEKNMVLIFKVKVTARAYVIRVWLFTLYLLNFWSFRIQTWWYIIISQIVQRKNEMAVFTVKVTAKVQNRSECLSRWTAVHFVTKLGVVMYHHSLECHEKNVGLLSSRSRSKQGLIWSTYDCFYCTKIWLFLLYQNMTLSAISNMTVSAISTYDCCYYIKIWLFLLYQIWRFLFLP